jgi:hypothetical protein
VEYRLRPFQPGDAAAVNEVALAAFASYRPNYDDWPEILEGIKLLNEPREV